MLKRKISFRLLFISSLMITVTIIAVSLIFLKDSQAGPWKKAVVKLYSNGQVVGKWEALDSGTIESNSIMFTIDRGRVVRINGTYSVETIK